MKKQLLITTFAAAFSCDAFAQETTSFNYAEKLQWLIQQGEAGKCPGLAKKLPKIKAILDEGTKRLNEIGAFNWTQDEIAKIEKYSNGHQEHKPTSQELTSGEAQTQQENTPEHTETVTQQ